MSDPAFFSDRSENSYLRCFEQKKSHSTPQKQNIVRWVFLRFFWVFLGFYGFFWFFWVFLFGTLDSCITGREGRGGKDSLHDVEVNYFTCGFTCHFFYLCLSCTLMF